MMVGETCVTRGIVIAPEEGVKYNISMLLFFTPLSAHLRNLGVRFWGYVHMGLYVNRCPAWFVIHAHKGGAVQCVLWQGSRSCHASSCGCRPRIPGSVVRATATAATF